MEQKKRYGLSVSYVVLLTLFLPITAAWLVWIGANIALNAGYEPDFKRLFGFYCIFAFLYFLIVLVLGVLNIICSFRAYRKQDLILCLNSMLIHKYGLIVFFFLNFIVSTLLSAAPLIISLVASRGTILFALPAVLPGFLFLFAVPVFFTWLSLIPGAFWGIQVVRLSRREGKLSARASVLHMVLQFMFLADVLDAMYLSVRKWGRGQKSFAVIAALCLLLFVATVTLFLRLP